MNSKLEESIQDLMNSFREMSDLVLSQLIHLEKFMVTDDDNFRHETFEIIFENERKIDGLELTINDKFINSIVLFQPVASDIRKLVAVYRMTINLERIGDLVINITDSISSIKDSEEYREMAGVILNMLLSGVSMVEKSLISFINGDTEYAIWTIKNDEIVDDMNRKLLINSIKKASIKARTREMLLSYVDLKNIITNIERIADHATNIAEASIYSLEGTDIRHKKFPEGTVEK
ncbi:MAG TPA: PhoU domain-containing protein [Bacteroidales bacterium]|nr:PhoU domain-containing protein [Bacteroidales bacterium]